MKYLKQLIENYARAYSEENAPHDMLKFLDDETGYLLRNSYNGHFTGSAWIVSPDRSKILMTHHKKLGKWIQLGGHADGKMIYSKWLYGKQKKNLEFNNLKF